MSTGAVATTTGFAQDTPFRLGGEGRKTLFLNSFLPEVCPYGKPKCYVCGFIDITN